MQEVKRIKSELKDRKCRFFFFFFFFPLGAAGVACGSSQARGQIGVTAAGLHHCWI